MDKLFRNYNLLVQGLDGEFQAFTLPYTMEFDIRRSKFGDANQCSIKIYNLNPNTRNNLRKDSTDFDINRRLTLSVGYGKSLSTIFDGTIFRCYSYRDGVTFVTEIEGMDAGFAFVNAEVQIDYSAGSTYQAIVEKIAKQLEPFGITRGAIGRIPGVTERAGSYAGNAIEILKNLTGRTFFIDNQKLFVLQDNETFDGTFNLISAETGLINTPILQETLVNCEMIMEPRILIGQKITLDSQTASNNNTTTDRLLINNFNGEYKVVGLEHKGTISQTVAGTAITKLSLAGSYTIGQLSGVL